MDLKLPDEAVQTTVSTVSGGILVAVFIFIGRTFAKMLGIPKRTAYLEQTSALLLSSQVPQIDASLLLLRTHCDGDEDAGETKRVMDELRTKRTSLIDHLAKLDVRT